MKQKRIFKWVFMLNLIFITQFANASANSEINKIIKAEEEPAGIVFEIASGSENSLEWALPMIKDYIKQVRQRFPDMAFAIVTHGSEQFALQTNKQQGNKKVHDLSKGLVAEGIDLHVCGTYASWRGISPEDFPEYVNVSETGPAQVNDYIAVGYIRIMINRPR